MHPYFHLHFKWTGKFQYIHAHYNCMIHTPAGKVQAKFQDRVSYTSNAFSPNLPLLHNNSTILRLHDVRKYEYNDSSLMKHSQNLKLNLHLVLSCLHYNCMTGTWESEGSMTEHPPTEEEEHPTPSSVSHPWHCLWSQMSHHSYRTICHSKLASISQSPLAPVLLRTWVTKLAAI